MGRTKKIDKGVFLPIWISEENRDYFIGEFNKKKEENRSYTRGRFFEEELLEPYKQSRRESKK